MCLYIPFPFVNREEFTAIVLLPELSTGPFKGILTRAGGGVGPQKQLLAGDHTLLTDTSLQMHIGWNVGPERYQEHDNNEKDRGQR